MDKKNFTHIVEECVKRMVKKEMPIVVTKDIGHGTDSKGIFIGREVHLQSYEK